MMSGDMPVPVSRTVSRIYWPGLIPWGSPFDGENAVVAQLDVEGSALLPHRMGGVRAEVHDDLLQSVWGLRGSAPIHSRVDPDADRRGVVAV